MTPFLLSDNQLLSPSQLALAARICHQSLQSVDARRTYIEDNNVDPRFALPDANWSNDSSNEFVKLFRRIAAADPDDLNRLRGFSSVFSGYNLFEMTPARGKTVSGMQFSDGFEAIVREKLVTNNQEFIDEWHILTRGLPRKFIFSPPGMLGEIGHVINGVIVNNDTCTYQERVNLILRSGLADWIQGRLESAGEVKICEIGGGYGALCHWFKEAFPGASYTIIDLPESLLFSELYISLTRPDLATAHGPQPVRFGVRFLPNYMAELLTESFDLIINTLSMSEMSEHQVGRYIDLMTTTWLRDGGMFFEQNHDNRHLGLLFAQDLFQLRFPRRGRLHNETLLFRNGYPNIWSLHPIALTERDGADRTVELVEDLGNFNLVREGAHYWGISKELGPTNPAKLDRRDYPPVMYYDTTAEAVRTKIRAAHPPAPTEQIAEDRTVELVEDLGDFNLVREGAHYWGISKELGPTDPAKLDRRDYPPIMYCDTTAEAVRTKILAAHPPAPTEQIAEDRTVELVEDLGDFNLVREGAHYWGISKELGPTDPAKLDRRDYPPVMYYDMTAEAVRTKILAAHPPAPTEQIAEDRSVELMEDLGDFNLVREGAHYWGISKGLGAIDPAKLDRRDYPPIMYCDTTAEAVRTKIQTAHPPAPTERTDKD